MQVTRTPQELMRFIVAAGGNLPLAAERAGISKSDLVTLVTGNDTTTLAESLRAMLILQIFDTIQQTNIAFIASLDRMSPDALSRALGTQLQAFTALSAAPTVDLAQENHDATIVKHKLVTRLDSWREQKLQEHQEKDGVG